MKKLRFTASQIMAICSGLLNPDTLIRGNMPPEEASPNEQKTQN